MIASLLAAIVAAPTIAPWDVAFNARFYYRDSRRSHVQLYVCALDGSRRTRVKIAKDVWDLQWVDRSHLAWIEGTYAGVKRLYISRAPFASKRLVKTALDIDFPESTFVRKDARLACTVDGHDFWLSARPPALVRRAKAPKNRWTASERLRKDRDKLFIDLQRKGGRASFRWRNPQISYQVNYGADSDTYEPDPEWVHGWEVADDNAPKPACVVASQGLTAHEGIELVFVLDWKRKTARLLPLNVARVSIAPHRDLLVGSGERLLSRFEDYDLWTSQLTVANLRTGKWRYIVKGRAWVHGIALRP